MKSSNNPYLKRIGKLVGEQNGSRALQKFVNVQRSKGESLEELARKLGVDRILQQKLPYEGALFRLADGELVIKLNSESSFARKRFTLAHEIAHLLLNTVPAFRSTCRADAALERTCDLIAAELLMPAVEATDFVRGLGSPSPEKLRDIASRYAVSVQVAALRVRDDLKLWNCSIGMWEPSPKVRTLWFAGGRRWGNVQPDPSCLALALASHHAVQTSDLWVRGTFTE
ncbi:MAG: ImmA/IrrE family metallo-endopeptidase, partial [Candidatus Acidiferrum sp.]